MTTVEALRVEDNIFNYVVRHNNRELEVSFPKTEVVYGNAPYIGDIVIKNGVTEMGRVSWFGVKHVLDRNIESFEDEVKLRGMTKWDLHDILKAIQMYEENYKTRRLSIGMYNDLGSVAKAVYYLINKF